MRRYRYQQEDIRDISWRGTYSNANYNAAHRNASWAHIAVIAERFALRVYNSFTRIRCHACVSHSKFDVLPVHVIFRRSHHFSVCHAAEVRSIRSSHSPNRLELSLRTVLALPKASRTVLLLSRISSMCLTATSAAEGLVRTVYRRDETSGRGGGGGVVLLRVAGFMFGVRIPGLAISKSSPPLLRH